MGVPTVVHEQVCAVADLGGNDRATWGFVPTAGNVLVVFWSRRGGGGGSDAGGGWNLRGTTAGGTFGPDGGAAFTRTAAGGGATSDVQMTSGWANGDSSKTTAYVLELAGADEATVAAAIGGGNSNTPSAGPISPPGGRGVLVMLWSIMYGDGSDPGWTAQGGFTERAQVNVGAGFHPHSELESKSDAA